MQHDQEALLDEMSIIQKQVNQLSQYANQNSQVTTVMHKLLTMKMQLDKISDFFTFANLIDRELFHLLAMTKHSDNPALSSLLFPFSLFKKYIDEAELILNLKSAVPLTTENFSSFLSAIRVYETGQDHNLMLILPFTDNSNYYMYQFHKLPTYARNHNNSRIVLKLEKPFFIVRTTLESVAFLSDIEFKLCMTFGNLALGLCVKHQISFKIPLNPGSAPPERICMENIIRFNNIDFCNFEEIDSSGVYRAVVKNRLYISLDRPVEAILNCKNGSSRAVLQPLDSSGPYLHDNN